MKILHVCHDFFSTKLYTVLIQSFSKNGYFQNVFVFLRRGQPIYYEKQDVSNVIYNIVNLTRVQTYFMRFFFNYRNNFLYSLLLINNKKNNWNVLHAHTWFVNGGLAWYIKKKNKIPYIVAVRNSDINFIYNYLFWFRKIGWNILSESEKIIFISYSYRNKVLNLAHKNDRNWIAEKSIVIPNPIDLFWYNNIGSAKEKKDLKFINLLFVGEINKNKRVGKIIDLVILLNQIGIKATLNIIGDFNTSFLHLIKIRYKINKYKFISHSNFQNDKSKLKSIYSKSDIFIMPSKFETFGLVYVEAMTQGTPVIYTRGQGFDGFFEEGTVGYSVDGEDMLEMKERIFDIINNYSKISENCINFSNLFSEDEINKRYVSVYKDVLNFFDK